MKKRTAWVILYDEPTSSNKTATTHVIGLAATRDDALNIIMSEVDDFDLDNLEEDDAGLRYEDGGNEVWAFESVIEGTTCDC